MADVLKIIRTQAILSFLDNVEAASLGEIAAHFSMKWERVLDLLWDAALVEVAGMPMTFDLQLPDKPDQWDGVGEPPGPDSLVTLGQAGSGSVPPLRLGLDEAMVLVALIDQALEVTPPDGATAPLRDLRVKLADAASDAGFSGVLWPEPESPIAPATLATITTAISTRRTVTISYHRQGGDLRERVDHVDIIPLSITTGTSPVLKAVRATETQAGTAQVLRNFRLDRIGAAAIGAALSDQQMKSAAALTKQEAEFCPQGQTVTLTTKRAAKWAAETLPGVTAVEEGDRLIMSLPITSEEWLFSLLVQLGDTVVAVEPPEIADRMAARSQRLSEEYQ